MFISANGLIILLYLLKYHCIYLHTFDYPGVRLCQCHNITLILRSGHLINHKQVVGFISWHTKWKNLPTGLINSQQMLWRNCIVYGYNVETTSSIKKTRNTEMNELTWISWSGWPFWNSLYLDKFVFQTS